MQKQLRPGDTKACHGCAGSRLQALPSGSTESRTDVSTASGQKGVDIVSFVHEPTARIQPELRRQVESGGHPRQNWEEMLHWAADIVFDDLDVSNDPIPQPIGCGFS